MTMTDNPASVIDEGTYTARLRGRPLDLTYKEFELLKYLAQHAGRVFTRAQLLEKVWGSELYDDHVVDVNIGNLRRKLEDDPSHPRHILTVWKAGYRLQR